MQLFKNVTLTLCQQQHPDDVWPPRGIQRRWIKSKEYEFNIKFYVEKGVCDLDFKSKHEWGWY